MPQGPRRLRAPPDVRNREFVDFVLQSTNTQNTADARRVLNRYIDDAIRSGSSMLRMEGLLGRMETKLEHMTKDFESTQESYAFVADRYGAVLGKKKLLQHKYDICAEALVKSTHELETAREGAALYEKLYIAEQKVSDLLHVRIRLLTEELHRGRRASESLECAICLESRANTVLLPCRHANFCTSCVAGLYATQEQNRCPICRTAIESFVPFNM